MNNFPSRAFPGLVALAFLGAACTPAPVATPTPTVDPLAVGHELFEVRGCAVCHGEDAQGTENGPGIGGHMVEDVVSQVRSPTGAMPAFGMDKITDEELTSIAAFIAAQPAAAMALGIEPTEAEREHLMAALEALEAGDAETALQNMQLAVEIASVDNREAYEHWAEEIEEGELSMVEHELEDLLAGHE